MKRGVRKKDKLKLIIIVAGIALLILICAAAYFLIFKPGVSYFGFTVPDFSQGANLGDVVGGSVNSNPWENTQLNPFANES
ncbi:MAG: hypothetical protein PHQ66_00570 [Candidatus Nanoarchaeia archaeon]|nr:hypothetical protein [Candidatus Nanoarchaeia archaeon]MDD5358060.1 hypothetical protein [Candidatus Nanoarchaeia archaeon]MDD5589248.1 hypothetical protein [Candidatus Nanoarchaeia archaeon]